MPKYLIERELPGVGQWSLEDLQAVAQRSCEVLRGMGDQVQWLESYVTEDKIYCVYVAPSPEAVREHARRGGFPVTRITEITRVIGPADGQG